jgi:hypothetical protein
MMKRTFFSAYILLVIFSACNPSNNNKAEHKYDDDVLSSIVSNTDSLKTFDFVLPKVDEIKKAMQLPIPILLCGDSLTIQQTITLIETKFLLFFPQEKAICRAQKEL